MEDHYTRFVILFVLFLLSAFFSGSETALMSIDRLRVKYLVQKKRRGARTLEDLLDQPDRLLGAILVGNNLVNIAISVFATGLFVTLYGERGELLTILVLTPLLLLFAEVSPKSYAARFDEKVAFWVLRPIQIVLLVLSPVVWLVTGFSRLFTRLLGTQDERPVISEDEIRTLITVGEETGVVATDKRQMLHGLFELSQTRVRDVMIPRTEVVGIDVSASFADVLAMIQDSRHSRFPVCEGSMDKILGIIHSKDILDYVDCTETFSLQQVMRAPFFVPESKLIESLLQAFRKKHVHLAVVVDEYGGVEGVVTLEDIFEEVFGEIQDEYDVEEESLREVAPGRFLVDGGISLKTLNRRFSLDLSEEYSTTLAGFLMQIMGTIPGDGDCCEWNGITFLVRRAVDKRVEMVEMVFPPAFKKD